MSSATETTPLIGNQTAAASSEAYAVAAESAIQSVIHGDVNASAFQVPGTEAQDDVEAPPAAGGPAGVLVTEEPLRADLFIVLGGMWVGAFLSALDGTIVATTLSVIGSEFGVSNSIAWLGTSYLMTQTAFQPLYGRFSDIFGRKPATLFASVVFLLGSLFCGLSKTYPQLIAARAFAGIGGGGLTTMSSIVTSDLIPLRKRGVYQGLGNVVYALGAAIGGPVGGLLGDTIGWRWAFLIQVPICVIHFIIVFWKVDIPSGPGDIVTKIKRIDFLGSLSLVASVALLLVGLSLGGNEQPWSAPIVWGSIVGGLVVLAIFVVIEKFIAKEPLLAPRILFSRTPGFVSLTNWFATMAQFGIIYQVPLYFSAVQQRSTSRAGMYLIPNAVLASTASLLAGLYMARTGNYRLLLLTAGVLGVIGPLLMSFWTQHTAEWVFWVSMGPAGIAYGAIITITLVALIAAVPPADMAASTGVSYLFRATGSVLGISLSTSIFQNTLKADLERRIVGKGAHHLIEKIRSDVNYIRTLPHDVRHLAIDAYDHSMHIVFIAITAAAFMALLALFPIRQHALPGSLDRKK
ncbi:BQ2448_170 [Microbotryum intermedium]|uniref:BQ2448_170 protein n=1 Tax=Microbotryum intermedium TaxID=269621 RepID=A0A238F5P4_9BASI|nr:BQ2448_170 [Microbotryum intermedium]